MKLQRPRGTSDILPEDVWRWQFVERTARRLAWLYGYGEIRTPVFESTELFTRSVGEATDIVSKEMYTFSDRGGRSLTLRPEGTAPVIRAYLENNRDRTEKAVKLYYLGPIFRYEKPQAGRQRQHHQFGVEAIGIAEPEQDAEVIQMLMHLYEELGLTGLALVINSVGCRQCRPGYNERLRQFLGRSQGELCGECRTRTATNPLRVFDCKKPECVAVIASAPRVTDSLCPSCREHFDVLCACLRDSGIDYVIKKELVRGLDYYTRTAFEIVAGELGAQNAVGGGGRYDDLIELLGGRPTPAVGFGTGLERILMVMEEQGVEPRREGGLEVTVAVWEREGIVAGRRLVRSLRTAGIAAEMDFSAGSLKSRLRRAHRLGVPFVLLLGKDELSRGTARLKDMRSGEERDVDAARAADEIRKAVGGR
jgi:histidyl-tRNA synthetase